MAHNAVEQLERFYGWLVVQLAPSPGRVHFALRLALVCALTALVAETYQTLDIALTIYVTFFLNQKERVTSLILDIAFLCLFSLIIGFVLLLAMVVINYPMWRVIGIALISFGLLYLASASKLKPVGAIMAMICAYALDKLGSVPLGEAATRGLLYAWLFVGIPSGVSIVVNLILARSPRRQAQDTIAWRLCIAAAMLRHADDKTRRQFRDALGEGIAPIEGWLHLAHIEHTVQHTDLAALQQSTRSTVVLLSAVDVMDRQPDITLPEWLRLHVAEQLEKMAAILRAGGYPVNITWDAPPARLPALSANLLSDIQNAILHFAEPQPSDAPQKPGKVKKSFLAKDAFSNPDHVHYAIKTTAAAIFCYLLYNILDWPGIHTCFITCYIVSLGTAAETVEKLSLRILGCVIGAAAGTAAIVFLVPNLVSIGALMLAVFAGGLVPAYVAGGGPRISYAGYQIAFAFFLCVVQGNSPAFDLAIARDRVVGILLGNLVTFVIFTTIWPVGVARRLDPAIASLLRQLAALAEYPFKQDRREQASHAQAALAAIQTDLQLARYEPAPLRPSPSWLAARSETIQALTELQSPLFLSANRGAPLPADVSIRLETLADMLNQPPSPRTDFLLKSIDHARDPLLATIDPLIARLERVIGGISEGGEKEASHAPA